MRLICMQQREVLKGLAQEQAQQLAFKREQERQKLACKREAPLGRATSSALPFQNVEYMTKSKFSISAKQSEQSARLAHRKLNQNANANPGRTLANTRGKENKASKVKPPPKVSIVLLLLDFFSCFESRILHQPLKISSFIRIRQLFENSIFLLHSLLWQGFEWS